MNTSTSDQLSIEPSLDLTQDASSQQQSQGNDGLTSGLRKNVAKRTGGAPKNREVYDDNDDDDHGSKTLANGSTIDSDETIHLDASDSDTEPNSQPRNMAKRTGGAPQNRESSANKLMPLGISSPSNDLNASDLDHGSEQSPSPSSQQQHQRSTSPN